MIEARDLTVAFGGTVVARVPELEIRPGTIVGLAGESGSGKSMTALALLGLTRHLGATVTGSVKLDGEELTVLSERRLRHIRGRRVALVLQSPRAALNPTLRLRAFARRTLALHGVPRREADARLRSVADSVLLAPDVLERFPHQVSGGEAQRFAIALALALGAEYVLADEPTSALDVTVQAEVIALLRRVRDEHGVGMLLISHDLAVIDNLAERTIVMRVGDVVESGDTKTVLGSPSDPYTRELLAAVPTIVEKP
ncbi:MAG TPA: ATP-binding cassette domain-containing protein [Gaiellaceae bacterium]|nr:ATP-binding cassette domain-containing protein [Gaiellaceae bacterium]